AHWSSTCRARPAAAATGSPCSGRPLRTRWSCSPASATWVTGRREMSALVYPRRFASLVKIEHTLFALPFAYVGAFLAVDGVPSAHDLVWITVAMVGARTLAMGLNRLIDAGIDARNPRTSGRELPRGLLRPWHVVALCLVSLAVFLAAVWQLDPIVRWLWPIPVIGFVVYPYLKRFTWLCHLWLGAGGGGGGVGRDHGEAGMAVVDSRPGGGHVGCRLRPLLLALRPGDRPGAGPALGRHPLRRARSLPRGTAPSCVNCDMSRGSRA